MALFHMLYLSRSTRDWTMAELAQLVAYSQRRNEQDGLTGLLLYGRGHFLQLLEGRRQPLLLTYDRIARDARHTDIELLLDGPIPARVFEGWAMGLLNVDQSGEVDRDRFDRLIAAFGPRQEPQAENALALSLLKEFRAHATARPAATRLPDLA
ncbi:BLUF domain-containing protein [Luteitalea sp. TBR-22]|uniref:BLUF domain-containing protein n=1 Tax=Luteitalea sp. TBR-22 TaxID=2802971 RepID=UPI001EF403A2|nr:BLUF domain-containing protein [Luteitalea sp. TBR-22]